MAKRPVFIPELDGPILVRTEQVEFEWFAGLAITQKQRSIDALHANALERFGLGAILEVSTRSRAALGSRLSAFNLMLTTDAHPKRLSVECAFQGSKVFERGGPYRDLYDMTSRDAKRDIRLQESGRLTGFRLGQIDWPLEPRTAFYDWLYLAALLEHDDLRDEIAGYKAFTDIEFNPERSINCQAYTVALYASLAARGQLDAVVKGRDAYLALVGGRPISQATLDTVQQPSLF
ncbi:hypothetical protein ABH945_006863 [Paraburkholderia sp. GAS333]|uniref:DarT1-associated NADAR antitoxin family protein n=1 Tax=Paraburkholderia sp. GAS333 TaxID=3156279 RepID=UPI003D1A17BA